MEPAHNLEPENTMPISVTQLHLYCHEYRHDHHHHNHHRWSQTTVSDTVKMHIQIHTHLYTVRHKKGAPRKIVITHTIIDQNK